MNIKELAQLIGTLAALPDDRGLAVTVEILDLKESWGNTRALVTPITGSGEAWVNLTTLRAVQS